MNKFRVLAIMTAYNEEDILVPSIRHLVQQGIDVYLIENWSKDSTYHLARELYNKGVIELERFPQDGPTGYFELRALLTRVEQIALESNADWVVHHDVDEVRVAPWSGTSYRDGLYRVDQKGYSCIDHLGITFHPIDNGFEPGTNFEAYFEHFDFEHFLSRIGNSNPHRKAWKNMGQRVSLASSGGHNVKFEGRRIFPMPFLLKHYPFRSQLHALRKIFRDRIPRYDPAEKESGWHVHYDQLRDGHNFVRDMSEVELLNEAQFIEKWILNGVGLEAEAS